ncbi:PTS glucitol/sorbitol transporter subunit IIA [uncultured Enterococcus sp.]|uniref:PTS glucitol/sorbitol transporter subunit IIA n=1 Tax=uncultured Enterococcus sp. TaxID=167972 RepID=UPI002AA8E4EA|nr:PTS glucitol/sorbitol transporter subunit IIA [uncultured Enterococcus sp.]
MYKSTVIEIGELVSSFAEEHLVILFGPEATSELRAISVIHQADKPDENVWMVGGKLRFGTQEYEIIKIGETANKNFDEQGHVSIYFEDEEKDVLPGAIIVQPKIFPSIAIGDKIEVTS